jgi:uncharacterized membrane protein
LGEAGAGKNQGAVSTTSQGGVVVASVKESIDVDVPVRTAYNQWTQFEEFPSFMEGVKEVRQLDDKRLFWRAEVGGKEKEWNAEISEQLPDERIAWHSTTGARNAGVVTFHRISDAKTRVMVQIDYDPEGAVETAGDALGILTGRVRGDLDRFKEFIETRGEETGAWRGKIRHPSDGPGTRRTATTKTARKTPTARKKGVRKQSRARSR